MQSKSRVSTYKLAAIGLMAAVAFVSNFFSIPLGEISRIHLGNVFCVLSGMLLGPLNGGLCGGIGAFLYDLTNPLYANEAIITFFTKFVLGAVAGLVSHAGGRRGQNFRWNLSGAILGSTSYVVLYLLKNFILQYYFQKNPMETVMANLAVKAGTSLINGAIAVVVAMLLMPVFLKAMKRSGIYDKLFASPAEK